MSEKRTHEEMIKDIIESCHSIIKYTRDSTFEEFFTDRKTIDATI